MAGVAGTRYLNDIHTRYFLHSGGRSNRQVYDIIPLDDYSKQLLYNGPGFKNFISTVCQLKTQPQQDSIYVPIESTQEIITQRYEKFLKEMQENNAHIANGLNRFVEKYNKHLVRKSAKLQKQNDKKNLGINKSVSESPTKIYHSVSSMVLSCDDSLPNPRNIILEKLAPPKRLVTLVPDQNIMAEIRNTRQDSGTSQKKLVRIKQLPMQTIVSSQLILPCNNQLQYSSNQEKKPSNHQITSPKVVSPTSKEMSEQYTVNGRAMNRLSIVTLPLNKQETQQTSHRARKLRYTQVSYEYERPPSRNQIINGFRIKPQAQVTGSQTWQRTGNLSQHPPNNRYDML